MITTPDKLMLDAAKLDAYLEAFEQTYLHFLDVGHDEQKQRTRGTFAFYGIKDMVEGLIAEMEELAGHLEVCNAILDVANTKDGGAV